MAQIPTYDMWKKDTYSMRHKRSKSLKMLDEAIKGRNEAAIKNTLGAWKFQQGRKGQNWRKSVRNNKMAISNLNRAVNPMNGRSLSPAEREAMEFISRSQAMALAKQFEGKELTFKSSTLIGMKNGAGTAWQRFKTGATSAKGAYSTGKGMYKSGQSIQSGVKLMQQGGRAAAHASASGDLTKQIMDFCKTLTPGMDPNKVFQHLNLGSVADFAGNLAPFLGAISSGKKMIMQWTGVARTAYGKHDTAQRRFAFKPGDPEAAFDAVLELLRRDIASQAAKAGVSTGAFTGKLLGAFADAGAVTGPVIGLLETLAEIFQIIVEYVKDYKEVEKANKYLRVGYLNLDIFEFSPILGCYFLLIQDHSTIINFAVADYGTPDFKLDAERMVKKINPVLDKARTYVHNSRFEIVGFDSMKGVVEKGYSKLGLMGKIKGAPGELASRIAKAVEAKLQSGDQPPPLKKSRISGISAQGHTP